jgi:hypothetical protein
MPSKVQQQSLPNSTRDQSLLKQGRRSFRGPFLHPLAVVCAVQAALSLTLVWSNTAFADEAQYLFSGQLEWAHWLDGARVPPYLASISGSPVIYPPLGAIVNSIGGLAGARILSLVFMLGTTVLLYLTTSRLLGRIAAVVAASLWALSEPTMRLAFATFDPLSIFLTALSAWLIVQAGYRYRRGAFAAVAAAALVLAIANAAAYSGVVIDPVLVTFAFIVWLPRLRPRRVVLFVTLFTGILVAFFVLLMTVSGSWQGLMSSIVNRSGSDHQSVLLVVYDSWGYSGLIAILAVIGAIIAFGAGSRQHIALLALLAATVFVVPAAQFHEQTAWSLDKHLAYGIWFAAMAAGYGCSRLICRLPGLGRNLAWLFCLIALVYPTANSWNSAWRVYHAWPNARSYIAAIAPIEDQTNGLIDIAGTGPENVAEYYTSQGRGWTRWSTALSLDPVRIQRGTWKSYYTTQLRSGKFEVIALFYSTTFSSAPDLSGRFLLSPGHTGTDKELLNLVGDNSGEPGLITLTLAVENDPDYRLAAAGPYDSATENGVYVIWEKKVQM